MEGPRKYQVRLSPEQRERFEQVVRNGHASAKKIQHARVLLMSDEDHPQGRWHDDQIAPALGLHLNTVGRVRKRFVLFGEHPALERKARLTPPVAPKLDGHAEAHLVAICCSDPPDGRVCWTMDLLAKELVGRGVVVSISGEAVRQCLKKTSCSRGGRSGSASPSARADASSRAWKRSWTCTPRRTTRRSR
jgi:hypothetical protein